MADLALVVHTQPPVAYYKGLRPAVDVAYPRLIRLDGIRSELRINAGQTPHAGATLDNTDGALTGLFADAPLLAEASLHADSTEVWRGVVSRVTCGPVIKLDIQA